jgi:small subunit ribosomal protein S20
MANNKSALKRIKINEKKRLQNRLYKSTIRTLIKTFLKHLNNYKISKDPNDKIQAQILLNKLYSLIDKACKKNIFHKNNAARKKSKLAGKLKIA